MTSEEEHSVGIDRPPDHTAARQVVGETATASTSASRNAPLRCLGVCHSTPKLPVLPNSPSEAASPLSCPPSHSTTTSVCPLSSPDWPPGVGELL